MRSSRPKVPETTPETREPRTHVYGNVGVEIRMVGDGMDICGWAKTLNTGGMSIVSDERFPANVECEFRLNFIDDGDSIDGHGWVVYANGNGMAIQFDKLPEPQREIIHTYVSRYPV